MRRKTTPTGASATSKTLRRGAGLIGSFGHVIILAYAQRLRDVTGIEVALSEIDIRPPQ